MTGTASQIEWAEQIKPRVNAEFDRVVNALHLAAGRQGDQDRLETGTIIALVEEHRKEVMAHDEAGYFIRDWQELKDQVRQWLALDSRYQTIRTNRKARSGSLATGELEL